MSSLEKDDKLFQFDNIFFFDKMYPYPLDQVLWKDNPQASSWYKVGLHAISQGRVGVILLAGGQGTRLGSSLPKGQFDLGLPSGKTLYQLYAERILKLEIMTDSTIPWYIMTSSATTDSTVKFFKKNNYFSLSLQCHILSSRGPSRTHRKRRTNKRCFRSQRQWGNVSFFKETWSSSEHEEKRCRYTFRVLC